MNFHMKMGNFRSKLGQNGQLGLKMPDFGVKGSIFGLSGTILASKGGI